VAVPVQKWCSRVMNRLTRRVPVASPRSTFPLIRALARGCREANSLWKREWTTLIGGKFEAVMSQIRPLGHVALTSNINFVIRFLDSVNEITRPCEV
jgi:hypothetical protein